MKRQVVIIDGGETFGTYDEYLEFLKTYVPSLDRIRSKKWHDTLGQEMGEGYDVLVPKMPNKLNAKYKEWKIYFENITSLLAKDVVLVGHSLGGLFLAKYLSENQYSKKIIATFLLAAPYDDKGKSYSLADFDLPDDLHRLQAQGGKIFLYQSKDDPVVEFGDFEKYQRVLPEAEVRIFSDRGHFSQEKFPELVSDIKSL